MVCLIFLIATREGTQQPIEAWRKAVSGIRLLASTKCHETCSKQCLEILKVNDISLSSEMQQLTLVQKLVQYLSHAVSFDINGIEATTRPLCQVIPPFDDRPGKEIRPKYPDGYNTSHYSAEVAEHQDRIRLGQLPVQTASNPLPLQSQAPASDMLKDESSYDPIMALPPLSFPPVGNAVWSATTRGYQQVSHVIVCVTEFG